MKATECRVGNYYDHNGEACKITPNVISELWDAERTWCKPFLLTETWLEKFGFNMVGGNAEKGSYLLWKNKITHDFDFVLNEPHSNKRIVTPIKYIHQLQNLYFALTNTELQTQVGRV